MKKIEIRLEFGLKKRRKRDVVNTEHELTRNQKPETGHKGILVQYGIGIVPVGHSRGSEEPWT